MPDQDMVRTRLTILSSAEMSFGVALAPVAGALAQLTLNLPWLVSAVMTALIFVITLCIFVEPKGIAEPEESDKVDSTAGTPGGNPFCDKYLLTLMVSLFCFGITVSGDVLVLPLLLSLAPFGFSGNDLDASRKAVANATGLAGIPMGIAQLLFSTLIFLWVTKRIGDIKTLMLGGLCIVVSYIVHGMTDSLWQVVLLQSLMGCGLGLLLPSFPPIIARWAMFKYPSQGAQASAVPFMGFIGGMMVGPLIMSAIIADGSRTRVALTYIVCAGCAALGTMIMSSTAGLILRATGAHKKEDGLSPVQLKMAKESGAIPGDQWVDQMCDKLREYLTKGSADYRGITTWHGWDQKFWARVMDKSFPKMPDLPPEKEMDNQSEELCNYISALLHVWWPVMNPEEREEAVELIKKEMPRCRYPGADDVVGFGPTVASRLAPWSAASRAPDPELGAASPKRVTPPALTSVTPPPPAAAAAGSQPDAVPVPAGGSAAAVAPAVGAL